MILDKLIMLIGRSLPEAILLLIFIQLLSKVKVKVKETFVLALISSSLSLILPLLVPAIDTSIIMATVMIVYFLFLIKVKNASISKSVLASVLGMCLLLASDAVSAAVLMGMLKIPQQLIVDKNPYVMALSTIGLVIVFIPSILILKKKGKASSEVEESKATSIE